MISKELLEPQSIVIVGASNDTTKPGGKVLYNILQNNYHGKLYGVNPKETIVQGIPCFHDCHSLPATDLAIIAVAANHVEEAIKILAYEKNCKAFILFSAGFSETGPAGKCLELRCVKIINDVGGTLVGPNCIGVITGSYKGVFAGPIPQHDPKGCDCVSASGATMVYILEMAIPRGLRFRDIFSVGNCAQVGVEDVLQYWDETFNEQTSSRIKLLYMEQINDPNKFLLHARSLVKKGCRIAAIKSGNTEAGSRAVSSHTGALAGSDSAVSALFRKAGIIRCYSRVELIYVAAIFTIPPLKGNRIAVITHAGGPGVMLTDILVKNGMKVPHLQGPKAELLLYKLFPGSTASNPIDFLATGTAEQLGAILDAVENDFEEIDAAVVLFGTTGMWSVDDVYMLLHEKMRTLSKAIFPILPSAMQAAEEVSHFQSMGHVNFTDEVSFGYVLSRVYKLQAPFPEPVLPEIDIDNCRQIVASAPKGYLSPGKVFELLQSVGIPTVAQAIVNDKAAALNQAKILGFPLVLKVSGILHKSDSGGVITGICNSEQLEQEVEKLMTIPGANGVILQQQLSGIEIYLGAKAEDHFGHQVLCGLGGIYVEVFKDMSSGLVPIGREEALSMIRHLKSYPLIKGVRGKKGVSEELIIDAILRLSALLKAIPEITEMDINPLIGHANLLTAVDARICIG